MSQLPFEIGYASAMSDDEMMDLDNELTARDFWNQDARIRELTDRYIKHFWRGPNQQGWPPPQLPMTFPAPHRFVEDHTRVEATTRTISVCVPECLHEETARLLVDMQLREQMFDHYRKD